MCLDNEGAVLPIQCGCACRGEAGFAHVACMIKAAQIHKSVQLVGVGGEGGGDGGDGGDGAEHGPQRTVALWNSAWHECRTCKQAFTGEMRLGLARAGLAMFSDRGASDPDLPPQIAALFRICATGNLAQALRIAGRCRAAEQLYREAHSTCVRLLGPGHPQTYLVIAGLASVLNKLGDCARAQALCAAVKR